MKAIEKVLEQIEQMKQDQDVELLSDGIIENAAEWSAQILIQAELRWTDEQGEAWTLSLVTGEPEEAGDLWSDYMDALDVDSHPQVRTSGHIENLIQNLEHAKQMSYKDIISEVKSKS